MNVYIEYGSVSPQSITALNQILTATLRDLATENQTQPGSRKSVR